MNHSEQYGRQEDENEQNMKNKMNTKVKDGEKGEMESEGE